MAVEDAPFAVASVTRADLALGAGLSYLITNPVSWTHRHSERVAFVNADYALRRVRVAFTYPSEEPVVSAMLEAGRGPVLLGMLAKGATDTAFAAVDEHDRARPVWSRSESERAAALCLAVTARMAAGSLTDPGDDVAAAQPPDLLLATLGLIATLPAPESVWLLARLREDGLGVDSSPAALAEAAHPWRSLANRLQQETDRVAGARAACEGDADAVAALLDTPVVSTLACLFALEAPLLVTLTREEAEDGGRRVMAYEYRKPLRNPAGWSPLRRALVGAREGLSLKTVVFKFEAPRMGRSATHGFVVAAPPGVEIVSGSLVAQGAESTKSPPESPVWNPPGILGRFARAFAAGTDTFVKALPDPSRAPLIEAFRAAWRVQPPRSTAGSERPDYLWLDVGWSSTRVTFEVDPSGPEPYNGRVDVELQASRDGLVRTAPLLSLGIAVLLLIGKGHLRAIDRGHGEDAAAALLIALPALLAVTIVSGGEHKLATYLLRGIRVVTGLVGLASIIAAASLVHAFSNEVDHGIWTWTAWTTAALTAVLFAAFAANFVRTQWRPPSDALLR